MFFFFSTLGIDRNTMTIFEPFCGFLTLLFLFLNFPPTRSVNRNLFNFRLARAVFDRARMVNGEGFHPGKPRGNVN